MVKESVSFFKEFVSAFQTTGAALPTSPWAAKALAQPLTERKSNIKILEVGSGTGAVTKKILKHMKFGDKLTVCDINHRMMEMLKQNLVKNIDFQKHSSNLSYFEGAVQNLPTDTKFDVIVCALPFLNFDRKTVEEIFSKLKALGKDQDSVMTFYQYIGLKCIGKRNPNKEIRQRFKELDSVFNVILLDHHSEKSRVWANVPPINIYKLKLNGVHGDEPSATSGSII